MNDKPTKTRAPRGRTLISGPLPDNAHFRLVWKGPVGVEGVKKVISELYDVKRILERTEAADNLKRILEPSGAPTR